MAQKVTESLEVSKETVEIYKGLDAIVKAAEQGKNMGLNDAALALHIVQNGMGPIGAALDNIKGVEAEFNEDLPEFVAAHGMGVAMISKSVTKLVKVLQAPKAPVA